MILGILQVVGALAGLVGLVLALSLGYRSPQSGEPLFELRVGAPDPAQDGAHLATFVVRNRDRQPVALRSLAMQRPAGAAFLAAVEVEDETGATRVSAEPADVVSLDNEIAGQGELELALYVQLPEGSSAGRVQVEVEYVESRYPTAVRSARIESIAEAA